MHNDTSLINIFSFGFILLVVYFAYMARINNYRSNYDLIDILYEVNPEAQVNIPLKIIKQNKAKFEEIGINKYINVTTTAAPTLVKKELTINNFTEIHHDCVNALMSLGMKKKESVKTVINIFNTHEIKSIEDFIKKAFVPNEYYKSST